MDELLNWNEVNRAMEIRSGLQKLVTGLRVKNDSDDYPTARLTHKMAAEGIAEINCGPNGKRSERIRECVMESRDLRAFREAFSAYHMTAERSIRQMSSGARYWNVITLHFDLKDRGARSKGQGVGNEGKR